MSLKGNKTNVCSIVIENKTEMWPNMKASQMLITTLVIIVTPCILWPMMAYVSVGKNVGYGYNDSLYVCTFFAVNDINFPINYLFPINIEIF
jgi:hypothetical protein